MSFRSDLIVFHEDADSTATGEHVSVGVYRMLHVQIEGNTFSGTVTFQVRQSEMTNWIDTAGFQTTDPNTWVTSTTDPTDEGYVIPVAGWAEVRCNMTRTAGSVTVKGRLSDGF